MITLDDALGGSEERRSSLVSIDESTDCENSSVREGTTSAAPKLCARTLRNQGARGCKRPRPSPRLHTHNQSSSIDRLKHAGKSSAHEERAKGQEPFQISASKAAENEPARPKAERADVPTHPQTVIQDCSTKGYRRGSGKDTCDSAKQRRKDKVSSALALARTQCALQLLPKPVPRPSSSSSSRRARREKKTEQRASFLI